MRVHRLRLVNFRQHEETDLHFDLGLTGIIGPNGSGKTTLLEALAWSIYGTRAARGQVATIRRRSAAPRSRVEAELEFTLGAHRFRVVRSLHGAELYQDGDPAPVANSPTAVTERLTHVLGMTHDEFFSTYFTGQKELAILGSMKPGERAQFLSRVLGYERLKAAQLRLKEARTVLKTRVEELEGRLISPVRLAEEEAEAERTLDATRTAAQAAAAALECASRELEQARPEWERLRELQERVRSLEGDLRVAEHKVENARDTHRNLDRELAEAITAQTRIGELRPQLAALPALLAERDQLDAAAQRVGRLRLLGGQLTEARRQLGALEERLAALPPTEVLAAARARAARTRAEAADAETTVEREHEAWVRDQQDADSQLKQLRDQYDDLKTQRDRLKQTGPEGDCPTCGRALGGTYKEVLRELEGQMTGVKGNGKFYGARKKQLAKEPKVLLAARGELRRAREELKGQTEELGRHEATEQARAGLAADAEAQRARLAELARELGGPAPPYDQLRHEQVRAELDRLDPLRFEVERLRNTAERAPRLATAASSAEAELSSCEASLQDIRAALAGTGWSPEAFARAREALDRHERARQDAERNAVRSDAEERIATAAREAVARRREERTKGEAELHRMELDLLLNQELDRAFSDLRGDLNDAMRPDLSDLGSRFLRELTTGRYGEMELDEEYRPIIVEDGEPQTVLSGGEEDVVSLALRLAISQMIAERAGQPLSLLILDEIFGSLDEERRTAVVDLLRRLADRFPQVILITHVDTVREGFDRVVRFDVDPERGTTRVSEDSAQGHDAAA